MKEEYLNSYSDKENTEWCNFWYDKANTKSDRRILFVGDSVARQVRRTMSEMTGCPVDLFATSAALRDKMFWDQWNCFFRNGLYQYDAIFIWVGNHSRMSEDGKSLYREPDYERFKMDFRTLVRKCEERSSKIIILSTLHMFEIKQHNKFLQIALRKLMLKLNEKLNATDNVVVEGKNRIMEEVAKEFDFIFHDIDADLMSSKFCHKDFIHYFPESNKYVAEILIEQLASTGIRFK